MISVLIFADIFIVTFISVALQHQMKALKIYRLKKERIKKIKLLDMVVELYDRK